MKPILTCLCCLLASLTIAQELMDDWGIVEEEDLKMTTYKQDASADAVVLKHNVDATYCHWKGKHAVKYTNHVQIKILTTEGVNQSDIQ